MQQLDTARLRIRQFTPGDIEPFICFMTEPDSTAFMAFSDEQKSRAGAKQLIEATLASYTSENPMLAFAVEEQVRGQFVGFCGLNPHNAETVEILYAVMPIARRQGYGTEMVTALTHYAFDTLGYHRAIAFIMPANQASKHLATKVGFKDSGLVSNENFTEKVHQFVLERETANQRSQLC